MQARDESDECQALADHAPYLGQEDPTALLGLSARLTARKGGGRFHAGQPYARCVVCGLF